MNRKVRCQATGEYGKSGQFYKVPDKQGGNKYYKTKEIYEKWLEQKQEKDNLLNYIKVDVLRYDSSQWLPTYFQKKLNEVCNNYPIEVVKQAFKDNLEKISYWLSREEKFDNEQGKLNYMLAIVKNNINNTYSKWKVEQRRLKQDVIKNVDIDMVNVEIQSSNKNKSDISEFL